MRQKSISWLAQVAGERAATHLAEIAADDPDTEVRQSAVFALSQSEDDAAIDTLIDIETLFNECAVTSLHRETAYS